MVGGSYDYALLPATVRRDEYLPALSCGTIRYLPGARAGLLDPPKPEVGYCLPKGDPTITV